MTLPDEILRCGYCHLEARIVRLKAGGIEHVIGYQRHPFVLAPSAVDVPVSSDHRQRGAPRNRREEGLTRQSALPDSEPQHPFGALVREREANGHPDGRLISDGRVRPLPVPNSPGRSRRARGVPPARNPRPAPRAGQLSTRG